MSDQPKVDIGALENELASVKGETIPPTDGSSSPNVRKTRIGGFSSDQPWRWLLTNMDTGSTFFAQANGEWTRGSHEDALRYWRKRGVDI